MTARAEDTQRELVDTLTFPTNDCKRSAKVAFQKRQLETKIMMGTIYGLPSKHIMCPVNFLFWANKRARRQSNPCIEANLTPKSTHKCILN